MEATLQLIAVADDPLARAGLSALLATLPGCEVVAQGTGALLFDAATGEAEIVADVIVWDTGRQSFEHDDEERLDGGLPILALVFDEEAAAVAWRLGSRGVLTRELDTDRLAAAVAAVAAGLVVVSPSLIAALTHGDAPTDESTVDLTPREVEVLALLAEGLTNKAIAYRLSISDHTVKFHVNAILTKLNAQSRTDAVVRASRLGLISL